MANQIELYIRREAAKRGMDPDVVMAIVNGEGGTADPTIRSRGYDASLGGQENSIGPFQLNMHRGLGANLLAQGVDVRDPANVYKGIDYALDQAAAGGWGPWKTTMDRLGYDRWTGIRTPATGSASAGDVGGLGRGSIMAAQQRGDTVAGGGITVAGGDNAPFTPPSIGDEKKPKSWSETLGEDVGKMGDLFKTDGRPFRGFNMPPAEWAGGGPPMPSVFRAQLTPTSVGGGDMRQLLAMLMRGGGGGMG
jgi:hypothetical protein